jgi:CRISPR-associated protein Csb1
LFELCPAALLFGMWDSTGPRGGLGVKFARAIVSEIVGVNGIQGKKTSSRIDPLNIRLNAGPLYKAADQSWTLEEAKAVQEKKKPVKLGKDGKPSEANHGNVTPSIADGGFTIAYALQTTVLSLPALRRLKFPLTGKPNPESDRAARTVLAALGLLAATLAIESDYDLRSRCFLVPEEPLRWELIGKPGARPRFFTVSAEQARKVFAEAVAKAAAQRLPWRKEELILRPAPELVTLVRKSHELAAAETGEGE